MSTRHICFFVFLGISSFAFPKSFASSEISQSVSADTQLEALMDLSFSKLQELSPELATFVGATREYNDRWTEHTEEAYFKQSKLMEGFLKRLDLIDASSLSPNNRINLQLLKEQCEETIESYAFGMHVVPLDHLSGIPFDVEMVLQSMPRKDNQDYENIILRLKRVPLMIDQTIDLLKSGIEKEITLPQVVMDNLTNNILRMIPDDVRLSTFYEPLKPDLDNSNSFQMTSLDLREFRENGLSIISTSIYPAYKRLYDFLINDYYPNCRKSVGVCALKSGKEWYEFRVRQQTTTKLTPEEIHAIGLGEVNRIREEIQKIVTTSGFDGSVQDYFTYLNTSAEFFYEDAESLLKGYRDITQYIDSELPKLFTRFPKLPYEVVTIPAHMEDGQIGAYYMRGSITTGRPGRFFVNTFDISRRPKWQMESLALHEAVPGHHFQISIAQEIEDMPEFRKYLGYTAYIEGWGLYSESLGSVLGLYKTPANQVGRLIEEIWRATRLVVDTGIHAFGWTRDRAVAYFVEQTGMSEKEATTEIDRYIVWPGQALAYKIGELSIIRMREEAKSVLKDSFDIRMFHDKLLSLGALPLDVCESEMRIWMHNLQDR